MCKHQVLLKTIGKMKDTQRKSHYILQGINHSKKSYRMDFDSYQFYLNTSVAYRIHSFSVVESEENNPSDPIAPRPRAETDGMK